MIFRFSLAHLCYAVSLWLCMHLHVVMNTFAMQSGWNYACISMWLCTFMLCSQRLAITCACDYVYLCHAVSSKLCTHEHVTMYIYAMQPAHNYVCMCMWLCTFRLCSYLVTMYACACDYAHLCHAVGLHLCIHEHVIMHIYVMHPAISRNVIMHIYVMPLACIYAFMSMWLCTYMLCTQLFQGLPRSL